MEAYVVLTEIKQNQSFSYKGTNFSDRVILLVGYCKDQEVCNPNIDLLIVNKLSQSEFAAWNARRWVIRYIKPYWKSKSEYQSSAKISSALQYCTEKHGVITKDCNTLYEVTLVPAANI